MAQTMQDASFGPVFVAVAIYLALHHVSHRCHVEFLLEHSLSVSVRLHLFPSVTVLCPSILFLPTILSFSVPSYCIQVRILFPSYPSHPFSFPH